MNLIDLSQENQYEKKRQAFGGTDLAEVIEKEFQHLPYEEENGDYYKAANVASWFFNLSSIITASTFLFAFIITKIGELPAAFPIAIVLTFGILVAVEAMLRKVAPQFFKQLFWRGWRSKTISLFLFMVSIGSFSLFMSYAGGFDFMAKAASAPPEYIAPTLSTATPIDIAAIETRYKPQIAKADANAAAYKKSREYREKLSIADANKHRKLLAISTEKEAAMNAEIKNAIAHNQKLEANTKSANQAAIAAAEAKHQSALLLHQTNIDYNGGGLSVWAIIAQLGFFFCIGYRKKFEWEVAKQYAIEAAPQPQQQPSPFQKQQATQQAGTAFSVNTAQQPSRAIITPFQARNNNAGTTTKQATVPPPLLPVQKNRTGVQNQFVKQPKKIVPQATQPVPTPTKQATETTHKTIVSTPAEDVQKWRKYAKIYFNRAHKETSSETTKQNNWNSYMEYKGLLEATGKYQLIESTNEQGKPSLDVKLRKK